MSITKQIIAAALLGAVSLTGFTQAAWAEKHLGKLTERKYIATGADGTEYYVFTDSVKDWGDGIIAFTDSATMSEQLRKRTDTRFPGAVIWDTSYIAQCSSLRYAAHRAFFFDSSDVLIRVVDVSDKMSSPRYGSIGFDIVKAACKTAGY